MRAGVLVISHGSRDAAWVKLVDEAVEAMKRPDDVPVYSSFLELVDGRLIQDGIDALEAQGVTDLFVLPLFVSSGATHVDDIGQAFGLPPAAYREGELPPFLVRQARVTVGKPIDDDPLIAEIVLDNIRELSEAPERETLLLVAHGSRERGLHRVWREGMQALAARVRALGGFARAETAMLLPDQAACVMQALQRQRRHLTAYSATDRAPAVIVAPLFLARGYFTNVVVPTRLAGFEYRYNGKSLLPHPHLTDWMERQVTDWLNRRL